MSLTILSLNPSSPKTLLLLHGAFSSPHEWTHVSLTPSLSSYHLLIPTLPSHGPPLPSNPSYSMPFNIPDTITLLASLIQKEAKEGKVDIVGLSLGGYVGLALAEKYPELVRSVFVTGCGRSWAKPGSWRIWGEGVMMFSMVYLITHLPISLSNSIYKYFNMQITPELFQDMKSNSRYGLGQMVVSAVAEGKGEGERDWGRTCETVGNKTCIVAAGLDDPVEETREKGRRLRRGNKGSLAVEVKGMRHAWNVQDPELFGRGVRAWVEGEEVPGEFVALE